MIKQEFLVATHLAWEPSNELIKCLVSWEVLSGGIMGNLLTDSSNVELSLWPDTKYRVQVTCKNKVSAALHSNTNTQHIHHSIHLSYLSLDFCLRNNKILQTRIFLSSIFLLFIYRRCCMAWSYAVIIHNSRSIIRCFFRIVHCVHIFARQANLSSKLPGIDYRSCTKIYNHRKLRRLPSSAAGIQYCACMGIIMAIISLSYVRSTQWLGWVLFEIWS